LQDYQEDLSKLLIIDNYGKHLISVQDLLQRHKLIEADILLVGEKVNRVCNEAQAFSEQVKNEDEDRDDGADIHIRNEQ
jgi:spectrin beta